MAQKERSTPEKQLLKLLEKDGASGASVKGKAARKRGPGLFSPGAWKGRFFFFKDGLSKGAGVRQFDIKSVNRMLILSITALIGYFSFTLYDSIYNMKTLPNLAAGTKDALKSAAFPAVSPLRAVSYYTEKVIERNIFRMGTTDITVVEEVVNVEPAEETIRELMQNLRLVGISWSSNPDAMIEDTEAVRTFFVKRGQMIGKLKVQAISQDKVILSYEGAEAELK
ncbi:MAG: hypothetical protein ABH875_02150 [Candidatus Omnitrophota bacterium]